MPALNASQTSAMQSSWPVIFDSVGMRGVVGCGANGAWTLNKSRFTYYNDGVGYASEPS
jgi:hypothetical protein